MSGIGEALDGPVTKMTAAPSPATAAAAWRELVVRVGIVRRGRKMGRGGEGMWSSSGEIERGGWRGERGGVVSSVGFCRARYTGAGRSDLA